MNAEILSILSQYGNSTVNQIRDNLASTGTNATGKTSQSLRFEVIDNGAKAQLKIFGRKYFATVETGRKATPQFTKPSYEFVKSIKEWLQAKGGDTRAAYAIAKHIHQKGTKLHQKGGRTDIVSSVVNQNLVDKISLDLLNKFAQQFLASAVKLFKDGNNSSGTSAGAST